MSGSSCRPIKQRSPSWLSSESRGYRVAWCLTIDSISKCPRLSMSTGLGDTARRRQGIAKKLWSEARRKHEGRTQQERTSEASLGEPVLLLRWKKRARGGLCGLRLNLKESGE